MSIFPNVTEQDPNNLLKLAEQQKNEGANKIKTRILKHTHDEKIAESLSPITKKLDEVKDSTKKLGDNIKQSQPETPQLAIKNTQPQLPIENKETVTYAVQLENKLQNMKDNTGFF